MKFQIRFNFLLTTLLYASTSFGYLLVKQRPIEESSSRIFISSEYEYSYGNSDLILNSFPYSFEKKHVQNLVTEIDQIISKNQMIGLGLKYQSFESNQKYSAGTGEEIASFTFQKGFSEPELRWTYLIDSLNRFDISHKVAIGPHIEQTDHVSGNSLQGGASTSFEYGFDKIAFKNLKNQENNDFFWRSHFYFEFFHKRQFNKGTELENFSITGGHILGAIFSILHQIKNLDTYSPLISEIRLHIPIKQSETYLNKYSRYESNFQVSGELEWLITYEQTSEKKVYFKFVGIKYPKYEYSLPGFQFVRNSSFDLGLGLGLNLAY